MKEWYNPSKTAVIYDGRSGQHIHPGQRINRQPDPMLVRVGKLLEIGNEDSPAVVENSAPLMITSTLVVDQLESKEPKEGRKNKK